MVKNTLFFETSLRGHRYEYLRNLYYACTERKIETFVFCIPEDERVKEWKHADNIKVVSLLQQQVDYLTNGNLLLLSYRKAKFIKNLVKEYDIKHVFLIFLMLYMPALIFFLPPTVTVSGIVYRSFLWEDILKQSRLRKIFEWMRYWVMAKSQKVSKVLLLNDEKSAETFNKKFSTDKFLRLPDPYTPLEGDLTDIRKDLSLKNSDILFILIGQLSGRKGTLEILDAIAMMTREELAHRHFFFAGKVVRDISDVFYTKMKYLTDRDAHIYVKDEFVSFEFLNSLCASCDGMLVPYKNTCQSSGAIGYAAQFGKPVIGPSRGLLGNLISRYRLGYQINDVSAEALCKAIVDFKRTPVPDDYVRDNKLDDFLEMCLNN